MNSWHPRIMKICGPVTVAGWAVLIAGSALAQPPQTGGVVGIAMSGSRAVADVAIYAHNEVPSPNRSSVARTGRDGSFAIRGLPPGRYIICLHNPGINWADPCLWTRTPLTVTVAAGRDTQAAIGVPEAARIRIRLVDTQNSLQKGVNEYYSPSVSFFVTDISGSPVRMPVPLVKQTPGVMEYEIAVPRERSYRLEASSPDVVLQNSGGQVLSRTGGTENFTVTANSQHQFIYTSTTRR